MSSQNKVVNKDDPTSMKELSAIGMSDSDRTDGHINKDMQKSLDNDTDNKLKPSKLEDTVAVNTTHNLELKQEPDTITVNKSDEQESGHKPDTCAISKSDKQELNHKPDTIIVNESDEQESGHKPDTISVNESGKKQLSHKPDTINVNKLDEQESGHKPDTITVNKSDNIVSKSDNPELDHKPDTVTINNSDKQKFGQKPDTITVNKSNKQGITESEDNIAINQPNESVIVKIQPQPRETILHGQCCMDSLPPLPKKVVRIFISSTFTDTKEERNALMQNVYPKLSSYCREQYGLEFQVVDMRWGVPEQASDNHSTSQLCIQEIKKCQEVSVGPNFVALVGDKYGYRPIPSVIEEPLFEKLRDSSKVIKLEEWNVVEDWYLKDQNAIPAVYVLQAISSKLQHYNNDDVHELKRQAQNEWNAINQRLVKALRQASHRAFTDGHITSTEKLNFFISVTENEIAEGLKFEQNQKLGETCFCIIRTIKDLPEHISKPQFPRYSDTTSNNQIDEEAQKLLQQLREAKLEKHLPKVNLMKLDIEWSVSGANMSLQQVKEPSSNNMEVPISEDHKTEHQKYLENLCGEFTTSVSGLIDQGGIKQRQMYDDVTLEVLQHWHLAKFRCDVFEGRENIMKEIDDYVNDDKFNGPMIVHGSSGSGKTSVMAKAVEDMSKKGLNYRIVPRFLGTTTSTSNLHQLLVSLCSQLANIAMEEWEEPEKFKELIESFHSLLLKSAAIPGVKVLVILDSIDQLMPAYNAFKLKWLPENSSVKLIVSTIDEGYSIYEAFKSRYGGSGFRDIHVQPLGQTLGLQVVSKWLSKDKRQITDNQKELINQIFATCSLPLYARILYDGIKQWKSYDIPNLQQVETTVRGAIDKLLTTLEDKFGAFMVKHSIGYLTAARNGLSESELEHILSLDDTLLNSVFKFWNPPIRRIPPLLWTRIRNEIHSYIVERSADDTLVMSWYHRQFIEATKAKYLADQTFKKYIHEHMVDYFSGKWGGGKEKPFQYSEAQVTRFRLESSYSTKDRQVPLQPYIIEYQVDGVTEVRFNKRKLSELPFHLIKSKDYESLKLSVFFSYDWLYAKLKSSTVQQLLEEFEIFMQADPIVKKSSELKLLYSNLQLVRPYVQQFPESLAYELTGRLAKFTGNNSYITNLIAECDTKGIKHCSVIPMVTCFKTADVGFTQNIQYRTTDPWIEGGAITCSQDFRSLYLLDHNDENICTLFIYDISSGEKVNQLTINKPQDGTTDMYSQLHLTKDGKLLLACYRQKPEGNKEKKFRDKYGLIDIIEIESGNVLRTFDGYLHDSEFLNPVQYLRENLVCIDFVDKMPVINIRNGEQKELNKPTFLSSDEKHFIVCGRNKATLRMYDNKDILLGEFDVTEPQMAVSGTDDMSLVIMMESNSRTIRLYDLTGKTTSYTGTSGQLIKCKKMLEMSDEKMRSKINSLFENRENEKRAFSRHRANVIISPKKDYFIVVFRGWEWIAYVYSLNVSTWAVKCIGALTEPQQCTEAYPQFSHEGSYILLSFGNRVRVVSSYTLEVIQEHEMTDKIKDICLSKCTNSIVVLLQKSILVLLVSAGDNYKKQQDTKSKAKDKTVSILFQRHVSNNHKYPEVIVRHLNERAVLEEVKDLTTYADTDRIASARSKRKHALYKTSTPNGRRAIHYHAKAQVIDTKAEQIVYTPKKDDILVRVTTSSDGKVMNEHVPFSRLEDAGNKNDFTLKKGDRLSNESNKVKFRIDSCEDGQYKILKVPSVLSVYSVDDLKLKLLQSVTVYKENLLTVSNNFIVTSKSTSHGHFVNIYNQNGGNLCATQMVNNPCQCACFTMDESQLFLVDSGLILTGYVGPLFNSLEQKVEVQKGDTPMHKINAIYLFERNRDYVLISYTPDGQLVYDERTYISVNLANKKTSQTMTLNPSFEDLSDDGSYGIDSNLFMYDLQCGKKIYQVSTIYNKRNYTSSSEMHILARISADNTKVVYVNKQDDTLHVAGVTSTASVHLFSCYCHTPDISSKNGLMLINEGQNILIRSKKGIMCFLLQTKSDGKDLNKGIVYANEARRAKSLADMWGRKNINIEEDSLYYQRKTMEHDMQMSITKETTPVASEFNRDNPEKPQVLVVCEPILSTLFRPEQLSSYLITDVMPVKSARNASVKLSTLDKSYDVIVLQLITDDVKTTDSDTCVENINHVVEICKGKCTLVFISLGPCHMDEKLNNKIQAVNEAIIQKYKTSSGVYLCKNTNLSDNGRPVAKYFQGGHVLSESGVKQVLVNIKEVMLPIIAKNAPDIQISGNKQLYMFWSKFL